MEFIRVGDKLIDLYKIIDTIRLILRMRSQGLSQQEVATRLEIDRTFISRLESLGNVRRGGRIGLIAFPVQNKAELISLADTFGIENRLILSNAERWQLVEDKNGLDFLHQIFNIIEQFRQCDTVLVFCSEKWNRLATALLDNQVYTVEIGRSPIAKDIYVDPQEVEKILNVLTDETMGEVK